jgi:hypothetical protein
MWKNTVDTFFWAYWVPVSCQSRILHFFALIQLSNDKIHIFKMLPVIEAFMLLWCSQGILCTLLKHHGHLYCLIISGCNLAVPVKSVCSSIVILPMNFYCLCAICPWTPVFFSTSSCKTGLFYQCSCIMQRVLFNYFLQLISSPLWCNIAGSVTLCTTDSSVSDVCCVLANCGANLCFS